MSPVPDYEDQVARLDQFRAAYPDVPVLLMGDRPTAWVGDQKVEHSTLRGLLDGLEEIFSSGARTSCTGTAQ
jgi:hypothetical protein